jgi:hypothetical protein
VELGQSNFVPSEISAKLSMASHQADHRDRSAEEPRPQRAQSAPLKIRVGFPALGVSSAGVFDSTNTLVRTIWSAQTNDPRVTNPAAAWDGMLDQGTVAPTGTYTVKLLQNNVQYNWDGVVGNSKQDHTTLLYHNWFYPILDLCVTATEIYFVTGYSERWPTIQVATTADPQTPRPCARSTFRITSLFTASDGVLAYFGIQAGSTDSAVVAVSTTDGAENYLCKKTQHMFTAPGTTYTYGDFTTAAGLDSTASFVSEMSGLAVQQGAGNYLFIARGQKNQILTVHKTTGATLQTNTTWTNPQRIATDPVSGALWVIHDNAGPVTVIEKLTADGSGNLTSTGVVISGLSAPLDLSVSPDGSTLLVADAGTSHQIKAFNTSDGSVKSAFGTSGVFGTAGGYVNSPAVTLTKFMFRAVVGISPGWLTYATDGSFWVGDNGNYRAMHFSSGNSPTYIEQIAYVGANYDVRLVRNDETRLLVDFLEFKIDYSKPLAPGNGSWTLVNNWVANLSPSEVAFTNSQTNRLIHALKAPNGLTYAGLYNSPSTYKFYELTATGLRYTGVIYLNFLYVDPNFDLWSTYAQGFTAGSTTSTWVNHLTGFDGSNNPVFQFPPNLSSSWAAKLLSAKLRLTTAVPTAIGGSTALSKKQYCRPTGVFTSKPNSHFRSLVM